MAWHQWHRTNSSEIELDADVRERVAIGLGVVVNVGVELIEHRGDLCFGEVRIGRESVSAQVKRRVVGPTTSDRRGERRAKG